MQDNTNINNNQESLSGDSRGAVELPGAMKNKQENATEWRPLAGPYDLRNAYDVMYLANALRDGQRLNREIELRPATDSGEKGAIDLWCRYSVRRAKTSKEMCFILEAGKAIKRIIEAGGIPKIRADKGFIFVSGEFFECPDFNLNNIK